MEKTIQPNKDKALQRYKRIIPKAAKWKKKKNIKNKKATNGEDRSTPTSATEFAREFIELKLNLRNPILTH